MIKTYGVYTHSRPDGSVFYVGKGTVARAKMMKRNKWHTAIVAKYGSSNILVNFVPCSSEEAAFDLEIKTILALKSSGIKLANLTNGGEGPSGIVWSEYSKQKLSATTKGRKLSPEHCANIAKAKQGKARSAETRAKLSASSKGKVLSVETRMKISASSSGKVRSPSHCLNMSIANKGKRPSDKTLAVAHAATKGKKMSIETRMKMSISGKGKVLSAATRSKIAAARTGTKHTPESIEKMKRVKQEAARAAEIASLFREVGK